LLLLFALVKFASLNGRQWQVASGAQGEGLDRWDAALEVMPCLSFVFIHSFFIFHRRASRMASTTPSSKMKTIADGLNSV
jgi:hypothetical protein